MYKYNMGGSVPRETNIAGQRHSLAYINPFEEDLLNTQYRGGEGQPVPPVPGPGGVPAYPPIDQGIGTEEYKEAVKVTAPQIKPYTPGSGRDERLADTLKVLAGTAARQKEKDKPSPLAPTVSVIPSTTGAVRPPPEEVQKIIDNQRPDGIMGAMYDIKKAPGMLLDDLKMGYRAGLFSDPAEQRTNLQNLKDANGNRMYTDFEIDEYLLQTAETKARQENQTYKIGSGGDEQSNIIGELATEVVDPCPEGYKMDPETNACVIDPDIGMGPPVFTPSDPNAAVGGSPGYTQPMGNFIPTPLQPNPVNPMQQQLNNITRSLQPQQNQQMAGGLAGIRR